MNYHKLRFGAWSFRALFVLKKSHRNYFSDDYLENIEKDAIFAAYNHQ